MEEKEKTIKVVTKIWEAMSSKEYAELALSVVPGINKRLIPTSIEIEGDKLELYAICSDVEPGLVGA